VLLLHIGVDQVDKYFVPNECPFGPHDGLHRRIDDISLSHLPLAFLLVFLIVEEFTRALSRVVMGRKGEGHLIPDPAATFFTKYIYTYISIPIIALSYATLSPRNRRMLCFALLFCSS
jgi:hypothetical protein